MTEAFLSRHLRTVTPDSALAASLNPAVDSCWSGRDRLPAHELPSRKPVVLIVPDPLPNAMVWRSLGSPGRIVLSQGLVDLIEEKDLRIIIREGVSCVRHASVPAATFCAAVELLLRERFSSLRTAGEGMTPQRAFTVAMLFPVLKFLRRRKEKLDLLSRTPQGLTDLMQSIDRIRKLHGRGSDRLDCWI
jgi:hypothetical protein